MNNILDYELTELGAVVEKLGFPKFRAEQLYQAVLSGKDYNDNINLPNDFLEALKNLDYILQPIKIYKQVSSKSSTTKFLYKLIDGNIIEGVLMQYKFGNTICISTQVGCKMNCSFCASALNGFVRNLTAGEIMGQIIAVNKHLGGGFNDRKITNIVLMGSGEPLDNFQNVSKFLKLVTDKSGFNFSARNISLSTCGIPNKIEELADLGYPINLCISLHAPNDNIRRSIMPIAKSYSISSILESAKHFYLMSNRRIFIEYTLIDGVNNKPEHARELADLLRDFPCHVNLIKLNEVEGRTLKTPSQDNCELFLNLLNRFRISATLRRSLGDDVEGACGQLRNKELSKNGDKIFERKQTNRQVKLESQPTKSKANKCGKYDYSTPNDRNSNSYDKRRGDSNCSKDYSGHDKKDNFGKKSYRKNDNSEFKSFERNEKPRTKFHSENENFDQKSYNKKDGYETRSYDKKNNFGHKPYAKKIGLGQKSYNDNNGFDARAYDKKDGSGFNSSSKSNYRQNKDLKSSGSFSAKKDFKRSGGTNRLNSGNGHNSGYKSGPSSSRQSRYSRGSTFHK